MICIYIESLKENKGKKFTFTIFNSEKECKLKNLQIISIGKGIQPKNKYSFDESEGNILVNYTDIIDQIKNPIIELSEEENNKVREILIENNIEITPQTSEIANQIVILQKMKEEKEEEISRLNEQINKLNIEAINLKEEINNFKTKINIEIFENIKTIKEWTNILFNILRINPKKVRKIFIDVREFLKGRDHFLLIERED